MRTVHILLLVLIGLVMLSGANVSTAAPQADLGGPVADVHITTTEIRWSPRVPHAGLTLTIAAPDGTGTRQEFGPDTAPALSVVGPSGQRRPDGLNTYELRAIPIIDQATRQALAAASEADREATVARLRQAGALPDAPVQSGHFQIAGGAFVLPISDAEPATASQPQGASTPPDVAAPLDVVTADDQIVQGSLCVGFDCVNNEAFGFDTIRLKENNLRIKFEDTSTTSGLPSNDWQLTANDSNSGGANKFAIEDITGAKVPFTLIAGAPSNSVYVASTGKVGLRTATPALDLHMSTGDTPAIRFEQNNTSGFTAQTWDIGANEANFFVRDLTGGSRLPFRIRPGAPTSSIDIAASGNVGIGTASPQSRLHVSGNTQVDGTTQLNGDVGIAGGPQVAGRVVELSDARAKQDFIPVDGQAVLRRLRDVPINTWRYRADVSGARHMGPTAQDFYAAFGLGEDEHHIAPLDSNGVALAAIQELDRKVAERDARIAALEQENADMADRLARLERLVAELAEK
jgi:hypothetical protein